jgi:hypothetical protein
MVLGITLRRSLRSAQVARHGGQYTFFSGMDLHRNAKDSNSPMALRAWKPSAPP